MKQTKSVRMSFCMGRNNDLSKNNLSRRSKVSGRSPRGHHSTMKSLGGQDCQLQTVHKTENSYSRDIQNNQTKWATKTSIHASLPESMECINSSNANPNSTMLSKTQQKVPINYNDISEIRPENNSIDERRSLVLIEEKYQMRRSSSAPRSDCKSRQESPDNPKNFKDWLAHKKEKEELKEFYGQIS